MDIFFKLLLEVKHIDRKGLGPYVSSSVNIHKLNPSMPRSRSITHVPKANLCLLHPLFQKRIALLTSNAIGLLGLFELYENGIIQNVFFLLSLPSFAYHILFVRLIHMVTFYCNFNVQRKLVYISLSYMTA